MLTKKTNAKDETKSKTIKTQVPATEGNLHSNGCCQPSSKAVRSSAKSSQSTIPLSCCEEQNDKKSSCKTRITIKYNAGFPNQLFIRGKGASLSWDKGQPLKNTKPDEWLWETDAHFTNCEFKILINDQIYENGENHHANAGATLLFSPSFY